MVDCDLATAHADRPPLQLVAGLQALADSRHRPAVTTLDDLQFVPRLPVQDVALPLGLTAEWPHEAAREGAQRLWRMRWPFWARRRLHGLRLEATDVDLAVVDGALVRPAGPGAPARARRLDA